MLKDEKVELSVIKDNKKGFKKTLGVLDYPGLIF